LGIYFFVYNFNRGKLCRYEYFMERTHFCAKENKHCIFMKILNIKEIGVNVDVNEHERLSNITLRQKLEQGFYCCSTFQSQ
jgi:hypothetical protein